MKYTFFAAAFCLLFASFGFAQADEINIIPKPQFLEVRNGGFLLNSKTKIVATEKAGRQIAPILNDILLKNLGFKLAVTSKTQKTNAINLVPEVINGDLSIDPEGYSIEINKDSVRISGRETGMFYALQSLVQLFPIDVKKNTRLPAVRIGDVPRFKYRGMHLDVSRHFMPVSFVKRYIDLLAQYKFNQFHWHLTDDQGWRIEIKKYPKLTEIGSKRPESHEGVYSTVFKGDGRPVEGFYTQAEIRDVVAYAKARYINVIPEIELPGHASAALAAYPELGRGCATVDYKFEVKKTWGIFKEVFCPTDETFKFLEDVLDETINLFPDSPYIHIGGDEVLKDYWKESPFVQELKKRENLKDEHEVQSYFVRRIEKHVNKRGKKIIGWDEILEGGIAPNATIMSWRGMKGGIEAAKAKHEVIMTPTDFAYLDYGQGDPAYELLNIGGYLPLEKVYQFDPIPKELTAEEGKYVLGGQANIWTEYIETGDKVEYMAFPRMLAIAESVWSTPENKSFTDFTRRLSANFLLLDKQNVNYRIPEPVGLRNMVVGGDGKATVELSPAIGTKIYYTLDGATPDEKSRAYDTPITVELKANEKIELKTVVANSIGRKSVVYAATLIRREMFPAVEPGERKPGVRFEIWATNPGDGIFTGETKSLAPAQLFTQLRSVKEFGFDQRSPFNVEFNGLINVPADGIYEFQVDSTWGASLDIGDGNIIDEKGTKDRKIKSAVIPLKAGFHEIGLRYSHGGGDMFFRVRYGIKGQGLRQIGGGELVH